MRLSNIKLSGFKSFVDPTNLVLSDNLVGIVGPNGCGKSNIIDAVMWVMGESSAKHLRGESLTDVIFNGSSARQPVGQASVELIFDNADSKLGGQYASYSEIAVKRQINHDAVSTYYLNGTRCRRRDITALFLGTGLGPRSYAIIEQGMITRLIEAKPEELRLFIEEAAGISKYRERRRETENRIKRTKENLLRLNDIRDELDTQLNHLQRQATAAEHYTVLKTQERQLQAELLALNWRGLNEEMQGFKTAVGTRQNAVEAVMATIRKSEATIENLRDQLSSANQHFNTMQSEYYKVGSNISQYQQKLQHTREKIAATTTDLEKTNQDHIKTVTQHEKDKAQYTALQLELNQLEPSLQTTRATSNQHYKLLNQAEESMQGWQVQWDKFNEEFSELAQQEQIDKTRWQHLEFSLDELAARRHQLEQAISQFDDSDFSNQFKRLQQSIAVEVTNQTALMDTYSEKQTQVKQYRERRTDLSLQLDKARQNFQSLKGRLSALQALQQSELETDQETVQWLKQNNLDQKPRLSQKIKINARWTLALETVMQDHLHAICVDEIVPYLDKLDDAPGKFSLINNAVQKRAAIKGLPRLIDEITAIVQVPAMLENIYLATSLADAISLLPNLADGQSVVTEQGIWLSHDWVIVNHRHDENDSILKREVEIDTLQEQLAQQKDEIESINTTLNETETALEQAEILLNEQQSVLTAAQQVIADLKAQIAATQAESNQQTIRYQQFVEELNANQAQTKTDQAEIEIIAQRLEQFSTDKQQRQQQREQLAHEKEQRREYLNSVRIAWQQSHNESHAIALQVESARSRYDSYEQAIKRNAIQLEHLTIRQQDLEHHLADAKSPIAAYQEKIEAYLTSKVEAEKALASARIKVQDIETAIRGSEQQHHQDGQELEKLRARLDQARLDANSCQVRIETVLGQLTEAGQTAEALLANLDETANHKQWSSQLGSITRKIERLGAINLAAIDEYAQSTERKTYLDSQHADITEALTTLDNAIRKIDKETRTRFKATFDELNENLKQMFPTLFGGGHAYLELMESDLLRTGVALMARPPGKKNSNIHLLSGGEKALTAVSLVFAIFRLNPAPFCILDEVDAPLDDTNIVRFCELLKSMSTEIQFIFITHNKITMEIANRLLGVTMHEPGVSRQVSVDINEATRMVATT